MNMMKAGAIEAAAALSATSHRSFADATRTVLDLLADQLPSAAVYLAHLDRGHDTYRIVDTRGGAGFGLRSNLALPLGAAPCLAMSEGRGPRLSADLANERPYEGLTWPAQAGIVSYIGVPLELSDGSRVGSLCAVAGEPGAFNDGELQLVAVLARVLAYELERESNERDLKRLNDSLRVQAHGMGAVQRVASALAAGPDARLAVCQAACEVTGAPIAFLLEPAGRELVSTAMHGIQMPPVVIQARTGAAAGAARAFSSVEGYFVADAHDHPALAQPLVDATGARSALFEPVVRDGVVAGVLILIWTEPVDALAEASAAVVKLLATEAAVAIEHADLRAKVDDLARTDRLTGLVRRRAWDEELPRELARGRRHEHPVALAWVALDALPAFVLDRGEKEGDRLLKEAAAMWAGELREVDLLARLDDDEFGVLLPGCGLGEACEVLDRVRRATPRGQTASAGVARWDGAEPPEVLLERAAAALATARVAGGDATVAAD